MALGILSPEQKNALELTYTCFRGTTAFLESVEGNLQPDEKLIARNLRDLAGVCERKLAEAFPELLAWLREWERT